MRKKKSLSLLLIFTALALVFIIPKPTSDKMRDVAMNFAMPFWQSAVKVKTAISGGKNDGLEYISREDYLQIKLENQLLKSEIDHAHQLMDHIISLSADLEIPLHGHAIERFSRNIKAVQLSRLDALPAEVIYRSPTTWSSSLWINAGHQTNEELGREIIAKNSPVLAGNALVGVIDYVGRKQSRVRLITNSGLSLSVRAARGYPQQLRFSKCLEELTNYLSRLKNDSISELQKKQLAQQLNALGKMISFGSECHLLAKGELHGSSQPLWRSNGDLLVGVGFNYDFEDDEGPSRDLRNGIPYGSNENTDPLPLIQLNDILITTGMDGVFPAGLEVAKVVAVKDLEEGDYAYEVLAMPLAGNLNELSLLFVMPPIGYDPDDRPSI